MQVLKSTASADEAESDREAESDSDMDTYYEEADVDVQRDIEPIRPARLSDNSSFSLPSIHVPKPKALCQPPASDVKIINELKIYNHIFCGIFNVKTLYVK